MKLNNRMKILKNLIDKDECRVLYTKLYDKLIHYKGDSLVPTSHSAYAIEETEELLLRLTSRMSYVTNKNLVPTYSYCRLYLTNDYLKPHVDRPACEYSLSLCIGGDPWDIWFQLNSPTVVSLSPGDGVLYLGLETTHWRNEFLGNECIQVFLHWVDCNGDYASWKYDRRPCIGSKETDKVYWGKT